MKARPTIITQDGMRPDAIERTIATHLGMAPAPTIIVAPKSTHGDLRDLGEKLTTACAMHGIEETHPKFARHLRELCDRPQEETSVHEISEMMKVANLQSSAEDTVPMKVEMTVFRRPVPMRNPGNLSNEPANSEPTLDELDLASGTALSGDLDILDGSDSESDTTSGQPF